MHHQKLAFQLSVNPTEIIYAVTRDPIHRPLVISWTCDKIHTMKPFIIPIITLVLCLFSPCAADNIKESSNYCMDETSWQQWHDLLEKHPQDDAIHALYATRRGLCSMVESKQIDLDRATRIFERMRESLIDRYREQEQVEQKEGKAM